jgi:V/A-type H+-transporting ATPase subunit I
MYGAPTYGTVDPTSLMAPFFFVFFGMCLGDAGYGLIVAALLLFVSSRHKITGSARKFFFILLGGAIATIVAGALTGSWMGDMIDSFAFLEPIRPIKNALKITDPMTDPMTYLGVSLALGFFQLIFGLCIAMWECLKRKDYLGAFADKGGWIVFLVGLAAFGLGKSGSLPAWTVSPAGALAGAGALVLFLTQGRDKPSLFGKALSGLLSLYNVTAYLGDTLSYSRLLALGLSSAAIGMIVNLLCNLVWDVPYVGMLIAAVIFVGGHTFSVAISILGAFIHSLRLQYVEFFSKFYEGNGRSFEPLACRTQYVRLSASAEGDGRA